MRASELIEYLQERIDNYGDGEVRWVGQPSWPFEYSLRSVISSVELQEALDAEAEELDDDNPESVDEDEPVIYIVEGSQLGYGNKRLFGEF